MINFLYSNIVPGGVFIFVIAITRFLFKKLVPRWTFKVLEIIAIIYMIFPINFATSFSIYNLASSEVMIDHTTQGGVPAMVTLSWVVGGIVCFLIVIRNYFEIHAIVNRAIPLINMNHVISRNENIFYSDEISSPISSGIFKKKIIFPKKLVSLDSQQFNFIICHENFHNLFQDNLIKMMSMLFLCVYWFHPCVWLLIYLLYLDIEVVCDEAVVKKFNKEQRTAYAKTIIKYASFGSGGFDMWCAGFSKTKTEDRIEKIMSGKKSTIVSFLSITFICLLSFMFATSPSASVGIDGNENNGNVISIQNKFNLSEIPVEVIPEKGD